MSYPSLEPRFIVVEGAIGAGKTTLARMLGKHYDARLELEKDEENPFIANFYKNRASTAFQTQIFFLMNRYHQYMKLAQRELFNSVVLTDFLFQRDRVFASINLKGHDLALYEQIYKLVENKVPKPDLVIFLQASTSVLMERIQKRGRSYENQIDAGYLDEVNRSLSSFFFYYSETPLLVINTDEFNFVEEKKAFQELINKINDHRIGREYFNPLGS